MTGPKRFPTEPRALHVVAGVIADARGRILLAQRPPGRALAGLWEFPGGKVEPGETAHAALVRELREELGIRVVVGAPLIAVPQRGQRGALVLDAYHVARFDGVATGLDGQALAWVAPGELARHAMPPADRPIVAALCMPDRYLVTPAPAAHGPGGDAAWLDALRRALGAGIARVQLRWPGHTDAARWAALVEAAAALCRDASAEVLVNGDIALARALGIGVHLRAAQLHGLAARPLPDSLPVAASCHGVDELHAAQRLGCGFAVVGPLRPTASHPGAGGIGWDGFTALREATALPLYAIGGMGPGDIAEGRRHGAQGIAAIRSLWPPW